MHREIAYIYTNIISNQEVGGWTNCLAASANGAVKEIITLLHIYKWFWIRNAQLTEHIETIYVQFSKLFSTIGNCLFTNTKSQYVTVDLKAFCRARLKCKENFTGAVKEKRKEKSHWHIIGTYVCSDPYL